MSLVLASTILFLLVSLVVLVRAIAHAPEGYEDSNGFHFAETSDSAVPVPARKVHPHAFAKAPMPKHAA